MIRLLTTMMVMTICVMSASAVWAQDADSMRRGDVRYQKMMDQRFEQADINKDQKIDEGEAITLRSDMFNRLDANNDKRVTRDEFSNRRGLKPDGTVDEPTAGMKRFQRMRDSAFDKLDMNKSGDISQGEMTEQAKTWFKNHDNNNDGVLSRDEWRQLDKRPVPTP